MSITALVTGGAGFIGSNLCKRLLELDYKVICLDNLLTGSMNNIKSLENNPNFYFKNADIIDLIDIPHVDIIFHMACAASPPKYQKDPVHTIKTSTIGTLNVLELARKHSAKILYASTSEIYGDPLEHPQKETYWGNVNTVGVRSCYDEGKRIGETMCYEFRKQYGVDTKIVRIFNTYGLNMDLEDGRVVTNFIKSIAENKPLSIFGDGSQTRCFCYVDDLIEGLLKMMNSSESGPINLGNPDNEMTIKKLVNIFEDILNRKLEVEYVELPGDDPKQRRPDISVAKKQLCWEPRISEYDGIKKTLEYFNVYK
jgi:UDP-glucuronate decarboxylase